MSSFRARLLGNYALFLEEVRQNYDLAERYYRRAVQADPNDPDVVGNYADFLENVRRDWDRAESLYQQALAVAPQHANNLTNYGTFLSEVRGDYDRAEALYRQALVSDPDHRNTLFKYAIFLTDVRGDFAGAEALYRRGLEVAPENPAMLSNWAALLLQQGKLQTGLEALSRALQSPSLQHPSADAAECWFYAFVYRAPAERPMALARLKELLLDGVRSPGWNLAPHVANGRQAGHPEAEWLELLAAVLTGESSPDMLAGWALWTQV